jgi:hypothetical protein
LQPSIAHRRTSVHPDSSRENTLTTRTPQVNSHYPRLAPQVGSVTVPQLIQLESFATVHQLVSTIVGQRCAAVSAIQVQGFSISP